MADPKDLPEGTDTVIAGASTTETEEALIVREPTTRDRAIEKLRSGTDKFSGQAADKARDLVGQGLERSSEIATGTALGARCASWLVTAIEQPQTK